MRLSAPVHELKRRAKRLSRNEHIPLSAAQDRIARSEGFAAWSLLAARMATNDEAAGLLADLVAGDMVLLAARPGQGKTRLGLQLLLDAVREARRSVLFTLEYTQEQARERFRLLDDRAGLACPEIVTSEEISADFIVRHLAAAPARSVAVIDYLQLLDQQRSKPPLAEQMKILQAFSKESGVIFGFISQIDRSFDGVRDDMPGLEDLRLPNPLPMEVFSKACFLHAGRMRLQALC